MIIYIIILLFALCLMLVRNSTIYFNIDSRIFLLYLFIIFIFIIEIFRSMSVGIDYRMYYILFKSCNFNEMRSESIEPGYAFLTNIAQYFNNFYILPFVVLLIGIVSMFLLNKIFSINKFTLLAFLVLTGFYFQSFDILRQFIAMSFIGIGISVFLKYYRHIFFRYILFIIFLIIATEFHNSAVVGILFIILPIIHYGKKTIVVSSVVTIFLALSSKIDSIAHNLSFTLVPYYQVKYNDSVSINASAADTGSSKIDIMFRLIPILFQLVLLYFFVDRNYHIENTKTKFILSGYLIYLLSSILIVFWGGWLRRLQLYLFIFPIFYSCIYMDEGCLKKYNNLIMMKDYYRNSSSFLGKTCFLSMWIITYLVKLFIDNERIVPYRFL